jgi:transcriptional regulator with XRE-family HTH domain
LALDFDGHPCDLLSLLSIRSTFPQASIHFVDSQKRNDDATRFEEMRKRNQRLQPSELVAANIRAWMARFSITGQELSRRLTEASWPLSETSISRLLRGKRRIDMNDLFAIADALRTTPDYLIRGEKGTLVLYRDENDEGRMFIDYTGESDGEH